LTCPSALRPATIGCAVGARVVGGVAGTVMGASRLRLCPHLLGLPSPLSCVGAMGAPPWCPSAMASLSGAVPLCRSTLAGAYGGTVPLPLALCLGLRCSAAAVALASPAGTSGAVGGRVAALPLPAPWCGPGFVAAPPLALSSVGSGLERGGGESLVSACGSMTTSLADRWRRRSWALFTILKASSFCPFPSSLRAFRMKT